MIASERIISKPGAVMTVRQLTLTPYWQAMLEVDLPNGIVLSKDKPWTWRDWLRRALSV